MKRRRILLRASLAALIAGAIVWAVFNRESLDPAALDAWLSQFGWWAPLAYVAVYAVAAVVFAPGSLFALAGGAMFGPVWGAMFNLTGATIGASLAFLIARYLAGDWVARKSGGRLRRLIKGVETEGWRFVAFVRLVPLFPFNLTNYALGLTRIGFLPYVVTSFVAMAPGAVAYTWLGYAGREALEGEGTAIRYGLLALGLLAAIAFLPRLVKRIRQQDRPDWISPDDLARRIRAREKLTILDVRSADEFIGPQGHITGAVNIPLNELDTRLDELRATGPSAVVVVCLTDRRSAIAQETLQDMGFGEVTVLRGGMTEWNILDFRNQHDLQSQCPETEISKQP